MRKAKYLKRNKIFLDGLNSRLGTPEERVESLNGGEKRQIIQSE